MGGVISRQGGEGVEGFFVALKVARFMGGRGGKGKEGDNRGDTITRRGHRSRYSRSEKNLNKNPNMSTLKTITF